MEIEDKRKLLKAGLEGLCIGLGLGIAAGIVYFFI